MRNIIFIILAALTVSCYGQKTIEKETTLKGGARFGENGDLIDSNKISGSNMIFYNDGDEYSTGSGSGDVSSDTITTFYDRPDGGFIQTIRGALEESVIDRQTANSEKGRGWYRERLSFTAGTDSAIFIDGRARADSTVYLSEIRVESTGELQGVDSVNGDTVYIDGTWAVDGTTEYVDFAWFTLQYIPSDSIYYQDPTFGNVEFVTTHNKIRANYRTLDNDGMVSKTGGMVWRHDNWLGEWNTTMTALASWHSVLDKYGVKATSALNERIELQWEGDYIKYAKFWQSIQARGHELASHGPQHQNHYWFVLPEDNNFTEDMPGIDHIGHGVTHDTVYCDTLAAGLQPGVTDPVLSPEGLDMWLKRSKELFAHAGLNPPTYWIEGGGLPVYFNPDSIYWASRINGYVGGGKYTDAFYKHMGFNTPWPGKSEFFIDWLADESISLSTNSEVDGPRNYTAPEAIKQLVDQSAKHAITQFRQHVQAKRIDDWYLELMDSILNFAVNNPYYIRAWTGSEAAKTVYQSQTNPYMNYMPSLDCNIDAEMGDTMPDGWTIGSTSAYWEAMAGSQGSLGCVSVNTGETTNLYLTRLYGIEKGINTFAIDIKDLGANDTVYVEFTYSYGDRYQTLSTAEINKAFPSTADWVTNTTEVTFPYNTSFVDIQVWSRTAQSYVDELTLKKKY